MTFFRKIGRWAVILYLTQAVIGVAGGVYLGAVYPDKLSEVLSCVAY